MLFLSSQPSLQTSSTSSGAFQNKKKNEEGRVLINRMQKDGSSKGKTISTIPDAVRNSSNYLWANISKIEQKIDNIEMEEDHYVLEEHPAGADPLIIDLYSEQHIDPTVRTSLTHCLTSSVGQGTKAKVLILGARAGLTAEIMLPFCSHLDLVETGGFERLLRERFEKGKEVRYFFGKEGFIGEHASVPKPEVGDRKVRVIGAEVFSGQVHPHYDIVILQNCIIEGKVNLVKELIKIEHDYLLTMLVPGFILSKSYFPFVSSLERKVLNQYYSKVFQEQLQSKRFITGRRSEIFFFQVFSWKKNSNSPKVQEQINAILEETEQATKGQDQTQPSHANIYETKELVDVYLNFHFGPNCMGVENYPQICAQVCIQKAKDCNISPRRALDLGCAVGRTSIDLASHFQEVVGLDFASAFIKAADSELHQKYKTISQRVKFVVGDACNLNPSLGKFDLVFGGNLIDRLPDPAAFLNSIGSFLEPQGVLILTSPYSWLEQFTPKEKWVGGYLENGKPVSTNEGLTRILCKAGFSELCPTEDIRFSIKDNEWVYQYTLACATFWVKK